jgi:hypothetical protein
MPHPSITAASEVVRRAIEATPGPLPPPFLVELLLSSWRRFLAIVHRDRGAESHEWRQAVDLTERLLWSVAPKPELKARDELQGALESLVEGIRQALEIADVPELDRRALLGELAQVHIARLQPERPGPYALATGERATADTVTLDMRDPRYAKLLDLLNGAEIEQVTL